MTPQGKEKSLMERHIQTILLTIITAAIIWVGAQLLSLTVGVAELRLMVATVQENSKTYVTREEANARGKIRDEQYISMDRRLTKVETRLESMPHLQTR